MADWVRAQGSTSNHPLKVILKDANGPIDLPAGTTVEIVCKQRGAALVKFSAAATVFAPGALVGDPNRGRVDYSANTTDLDTPGIFEVQYIVTIPTMAPQRFPEDGYMQLLVMPDAESV